MGADPAATAVNGFSQAWCVLNVPVVGGSAFRPLPGTSATATTGALALWSARANRDTYLRHERPIADSLRPETGWAREASVCLGGQCVTGGCPGLVILLGRLRRP